MSKSGLTTMLEDAKKEQPPLPFSQILASSETLEPLKGKNLDEPIPLIAEYLSNHVTTVKSPKFQSKKTKNNNLFRDDFIDKLTHLMVALSVYSHQRTLLFSPYSFCIPEEAGTAPLLNPLLINQAACGKLFQSYRENVWNLFLGKASSKIPWKDDVIRDKPEQGSPWFTTKATTLSNIFLRSSPNIINTIQIRSLPEEADQTIVERGYVQSFAKMWRKIEQEKRSGYRSSLNDGNDPTEEELSFAATITSYILEHLPFVLITQDDNAALINALFEQDPKLTLQKLTANTGQYIPLENHGDRITAMLTAQQQNNMDAYLLYVLMQGGEAKFCPPPPQPEPVPAPEGNIDAEHPTAPVVGVKAEGTSEQALEAKAETVPEQDLKIIQRRYALEKIEGQKPGATMLLHTPLHVPEPTMKTEVLQETTPTRPGLIRGLSTHFKPKKPEEKEAQPETEMGTSPPKFGLFGRAMSKMGLVNNTEEEELSTSPQKNESKLHKLRGLVHRNPTGRQSPSPDASPETSPSAHRRIGSRHSKGNSPSTSPQHSPPTERKSDAKNMSPKSSELLDSESGSTAEKKHTLSRNRKSRPSNPDPSTEEKKESHTSIKSLRRMKWENSKSLPNLHKHRHIRKSDTSAPDEPLLSESGGIPENTATVTVHDQTWATEELRKVTSRDTIRKQVTEEKVKEITGAGQRPRSLTGPSQFGSSSSSQEEKEKQKREAKRQSSDVEATSLS